MNAPAPAVGPLCASPRCPVTDRVGWHRPGLVLGGDGGGPRVACTHPDPYPPLPPAVALALDGHALPPGLPGHRPDCPCAGCAEARVSIFTGVNGERLAAVLDDTEGAVILAAKWQTSMLGPAGAARLGLRLLLLAELAAARLAEIGGDGGDQADGAASPPARPPVVPSFIVTPDPYSTWGGLPS